MSISFMKIGKLVSVISIVVFWVMILSRLVVTDVSEEDTASTFRVEVPSILKISCEKFKSRLP